MAATNPIAEPRKQKITTFLWFDSNAEEAANFYVSVFKNSRILETTHYTSAGPRPEGTVMTIAFELDEQQFTALNGGPQFKFTEAISLVVNCQSQEEVDYFWHKLTEGGGQEGQCGWVEDKYGLSWQIVPDALMKLVKGTEASKVDRVLQALRQMKKLDIKKLEEAAAG